MRRINRVQCQRCLASYDTRLLKFRIQLLCITYERCDVCHRWARHRVVMDPGRSGPGQG